MSIRFITPNQHGVLDFAVAAVLIVLPFALGLGPVATYISVATGIASIGLSLLTDYKYGVYRVIPFWGHLAVDGAIGVAFALIPFVFGFTGIDALYFWVNAAGVLAVVGLGLTREPSSSGIDGGLRA